MIDINWKILIPQLLTFLVALPFVYSMYIKALRDTLKTRGDAIQNAIDTAEKNKAEMETLKAEYEQKVREMDAKTKEAVAAAAAEGEKIRLKMTEDAKVQGAAIIADAKAELEIEKRKAIEEVKDKIVDITVLAAETIIKKKLSKKEQVGIVEKYMKEIEKRVN